MSEDASLAKYKFAWLRALWARSDLTAGEKLTGTVLADHFNSDTAQLNPSLPAISRETSQNIRTTRKNLAKLISLGLIDRNSGGGRRSSHYSLTWGNGVLLCAITLRPEGSAADSEPAPMDAASLRPEGSAADSEPAPMDAASLRPEGSAADSEPAPMDAASLRPEGSAADSEPAPMDAASLRPEGSAADSEPAPMDAASLRPEGSEPAPIGAPNQKNHKSNLGAREKLQLFRRGIGEKAWASIMQGTSFEIGPPPTLIFEREFQRAALLAKHGQRIQEMLSEFRFRMKGEAA